MGKDASFPDGTDEFTGGVIDLDTFESTGGLLGASGAVAA
jgi:hypothetical protein